MRQEHETATSFNQLKAITQAIMLKKGVQEKATHQESDRTQEPTQKTTLRPKASTQTKKGRLNPTKRAFSERQRTAFRDNSQAIAKTSYKTKASDNANAFTTEQTNNSSLKTEPSDEALKQGLENTQSKGSEHEA